MPAEPYALPELDGAGPSSPGPAAPAGLLSQAAEEGRRRGFEQGLEDARGEITSACQALLAATELVERELETLSRAVERRAAQLAILVAEKIVAEALALDPERVVPIVSQALRRVAADDRVVVAVSPHDLEAVRAAEADLARQLATHTRLEIVPDRRVGRGGCVVTTSVGEIDARIEEQLARAREVVADALAEEAPPGG